MATARAKDKGWQAVWNLPGGKRGARQSRLWSKREALQFAEEQEAKARRTPWSPGQSSEVPRFDDYAARYFTDRIVSPGTAHKEATISRRLDETFGEHRLNEVSPAEVRDWLNGLVTTYSRQYASDIRGLMLAIFNRAVIDGLVSVNPVSVVKLPGAKRKPRAVPIPLDAIPRIADEVGERHRVLVLLMAGTGMRVGEASAIRVADLDLSGATPTVSVVLSVSKDESGCEVIKSGGKTEAATRVIALPAWLGRELREHLVRTGIRDGFVFAGPKGGQPSPKNFRRRVWQPATERLGHPEWKIHGLRHSHASLLIGAGRPLPEVAARLGHADAGVTMKVYSHLLASDDSAAAEVVPDLGEATG